MASNVRLEPKPMEHPQLSAVIGYGLDGAEHSLCYWRTTDAIGHGQNLALDLGREVQHSHDLCYAGSGYAFLTGYVSLSIGLAGVEPPSPLDGFAEELDHPRRFGFSRWFGIASVWRGSVDHPVDRHLARQGADVAVLEGPLGAEGYLDALFAVGRHRGATVGNLGEMNDPEPDLGVHLAVSRPAHLGSQCNSIRSVEGSAICVTPRWF